MNQNSSPTPRRPHSSPAQRARWVARFQRSGLSQRAFAQQQGLNLFTLRQWIHSRSSRHQARRAASSPRSAPPLRELPLSSWLGAAAAPTWAAELSSPAGAALRLSAQLPPALLPALLRAWRRSC